MCVCVSAQGYGGKQFFVSSAQTRGEGSRLDWSHVNQGINTRPGNPEVRGWGG